MSDRASIFEDDDFDVSAFAPKKDNNAAQVPAEAVREVSERTPFRSREPVTPKRKPTVREARRHRTGRNIQINLKVRAEALEAFYKIAEEENWVQGETFENAVAALNRERAAKAKSS